MRCFARDDTCTDPGWCNPIRCRVSDAAKKPKKVDAFTATFNRATRLQAQNDMLVEALADLVKTARQYKTGGCWEPLDEQALAAAESALKTAKAHPA